MVNRSANDELSAEFSTHTTEQNGARQHQRAP